MTSKNTIGVWSQEDTGDTKQALPSFGKAHITTTDVDVSVLTQNLHRVLSDFQHVLDEQPESESKYFVDEIEISLGVNGKGSIALIGKIEAGMEASIKVKLKRKP